MSVYDFLKASRIREPSRIPIPIPKLNETAPNGPESYVALTETDGRHESNFHFIRWEGNQEALRHLRGQLDKVRDWVIVDRNGAPYSAFGLDLDCLIPARAVEEMLKVETNGYIWCTKINERMRMVDLGFAGECFLDDRAMSRKAFNMIGQGRIDKSFF